MTATQDQRQATTHQPGCAQIAAVGNAADPGLPVVLHALAEAARELLGSPDVAITVVAGDEECQHAIPSGRPAVEVPLTAGTRGRGSGELNIPISFAGTLLGNLCITEHADGRNFSAQEQRMALVLATTAGGAIANAVRYSESERRRRWLVASSELTNQILSIDGSPSLSLITQHALDAAGADFVSLSIPREGSQAVVAAVSSAVGSEVTRRTLSVADSVAGQVLLTTTPALVFAPDVSRSPGPDVELGPLLVVPLTAAGHTRGALTFGRAAEGTAFTEIDLNMAASFAVQAALALELAEARELQLRLRKLEDHDRIAADLHDHVIQELFAVGMGLQGLAGITDQPAQLSRITTYVDLLDKVIGTIRTTIFQMQPAGHDPTGLQSRILDIAGEHTAQLGYMPHVRFSGALDSGVHEPLAADVLAVIRESISNCARHAHATRLEISVSLNQGELLLEIADNGRGLGTPTRSSGLSNIRHRAEAHDGKLTITTPARGGTTLTWSASAHTRPAA